MLQARLLQKMDVLYTSDLRNVNFDLEKSTQRVEYEHAHMFSKKINAHLSGSAPVSLS